MSFISGLQGMNEWQRKVSSSVLLWILQGLLSGSIS